MEQKGQGSPCSGKMGPETKLWATLWCPRVLWECPSGDLGAQMSQRSAESADTEPTGKEDGPSWIQTVGALSVCLSTASCHGGAGVGNSHTGLSAGDQALIASSAWGSGGLTYCFPGREAPVSPRLTMVQTWLVLLSELGWHLWGPPKGWAGVGAKVLPSQQEVSGPLCPRLWHLHLTGCVRVCVWACAGMCACMCGLLLLLSRFSRVRLCATP